MKGPALTSAFPVTEPLAAAVFVNSTMRRTLMLFAGRELSLGEASHLANVELKQLYNRVVRLVRLGLLKNTGMRPRPGRPIKIYSAASTSFFVPRELLPRSHSDGLASELRSLLVTEQHRAMAGLLVSLGSSGEPVMRFVPIAESRQRTFEFWQILHLSAADFDRLRADLQGVLRKYQRPATNSGGVYLIHAAGAQRLEQGGVLDNPKPGGSKTSA